MKRCLYFLCLLLTLPTLTCTGQQTTETPPVSIADLPKLHNEPKVKPIQIKVNDERTKVIGFEFYDTLGLCISKFNFIENNPYNHLEAKVKEVDFAGNNVYILDTNKVDRKYFVSDKNLPNYTEKLTPATIRSDCFYFEYGIKYTTMAYVLETYNTDGAIISFHSTVFIFNSKGEITSKLEHLDTPIGGLAVTQDGKYLILTYGFPLGCGNEEIGNQGFDIYSTATQKVVYSEQQEKNQQDPRAVSNSLIMVSYKVYNEENTFDKTYRFFDIENQIEYNKTFTKEELNNLVQIGDEGITIRMNNNLVFKPYTSFLSNKIIKK